MTATCPGPTLGVVGGGQLGRMLSEAAAPLGVDVVVLDPTPSCPASRVAEQIRGDYDDLDAVGELAERADALTLEIELADPDVLETVREEYDVPVHPDPSTLRTIQDKLVQKRTLADAGVPVPEFVAVDDADDLRDAVEALGPVMTKARTGGYDGRGNAPAHEPADAAAALDAVGTPAMAEAFVDYERELSVIGVVGAEETAAFPATETIHEAEILRETVVPARSESAVLERAQSVAADALDALEGRGVYGVELFETADGDVLLNEIAPRPHNSGHWTIEGAHHSQFEQHVRAVLGWPLGDAEVRTPTVTANVLGDAADPRPAELRDVGSALSAPQTHLHWYGKAEVRPLRKMGHVTATAAPDQSPEELLEATRKRRDALSFASPETATTTGVTAASKPESESEPEPEP
ncbi:MAG: 5-(carboxyamino)imidazole ribonucleotide synthase [Halolamina sp.]